MREDWIECKLEDLLDYEQPTKYIIRDEKYSDEYPTPVLTAGKSFIKGYTNEDFGIFDNLPTIIFDDFTTASQFVNFKFKVKSSAMKILVPTSNLVNLKFAFGAMQVNKVRSETHKRYWISEYSKLVIGLPPLVEQRVIVKKLESLFSSLDAGVADLKKAQQQLKIYRQAVLKKAFEGDLTKEWREKQYNLPDSNEVLKIVEQERENYYNSNIEEWKNSTDKRKAKPQKNKYYSKISNDDYDNLPKLPSNWGWEKFGNVCLKIMDGTHFSPKNVEKGDYKYITAKNIKEGRIDLKKLSFVTKEDHSEIFARCDVKKGDILYIKDGATAGIAAVNPFDEEFSLLSSVGVFRTSHNVILPKFMEYYLNAQITKNRMLSNISGVAITRLTLIKLNNSIFVICSPEEQKQIVKQIESRLSVCDSIERNIKESLFKAEALRQSILKKAFEGNLLTAQELAECKLAEDYEPASVLLERIKAKQKKATAKPGKKELAKPLVVAKVETLVAKISADIHAGLIAKVIKIHEENPASIENLSHIKCEKIAHLVEYHLHIPLGRQPVKDAAGPDDYPHLKKIEHRAKMANYFAIQKRDIGYTYSSTKNSAQAIEKFQSVLSDEKNKQLDHLIALFLNFDLEASEIIATTYAGWNNLILNGNANPSDEEIVYESRDNWSERKLKIARERFFKAIDWISKNEIVPTGYGAVVPFPKKKKK